MRILISTCLILITFISWGQVYTNTYSASNARAAGPFGVNVLQNEYRITPPNKDFLLQLEGREEAYGESKGFKFAHAIDVAINALQYGNWTTVGDNAFWSVKFVAPGATCLSINFSKFKLPAHAEMYIGNGDHTMVTGPITAGENNANATWGSSVYKGDALEITIKLPAAERIELALETKSIAYGYKEIFVPKTGYGESGACNINVLCALGNGWENERSAVALLLDGSSQRFCTGSMIANTCGTNTPYFLTANHCFNGSDVSQWKFVFRYWSSQCTPGVDGSTSLLFNGSQLRANSAATDFCLLQLNQVPSSASGITYAGWNRSATAATSGTAIHHPRGDVMKISRANNALTVGTFGTAQGAITNGMWQANWSPQVNGSGQMVTPVTEPGSSGSPLFDQNHRIVGQLFGGPSACSGTQLWDFYGRFDLSWTGGGTNATRLSNWLDASGTGAIAINSASIAGLSPYNDFAINGANYICNSETFTIRNLPSAGYSVAWQILQSGSIVSSTVNGSSITINKITNGSIELDAVITNLCTNTSKFVSKILIVGTGTTGRFWLHGQNFDYTATGPGNSYTVCPNESLWFEPYYGSSGNPSLAHIWTISGNYTLQSGLNGPTLSVQAPSPIRDAFSITYQYNSVCGGWSDIAYGGAGTMDCAGGEEPYRIAVNDGGRNNSAATGKIAAYPNPVKTQLVVNVDIDHAKGSITLVDQHGRFVYQGTITGKQNLINVSQVANGVYYLRLIVNGKASTTKVIISK